MQIPNGVRREVAELLAGAGTGVTRADLAVRMPLLPAPVQRYLRYAIGETATGVRTVRLRHDGTFQAKPGGGWAAIEGEEHFTVSKPGLLWFARTKLGPFGVQVRDLLQDGHGQMLVKLAGLIPVVNERGPAIDQGAYLRWLGEAVWFPYAYAIQQLEWVPMDDLAARAILRDGGVEVSARFDFERDGKIRSMSATRYYSEGGGRATLRPWIARCGEYREFSGLRVPGDVEVAWDLEGQDYPYARFRVTELEVEAAQPQG